MKTITGYRSGDSVTLEPSTVDAEPVTILLEDDVTIRANLAGRQLVYREGCAYGTTLAAALTLGWARLVE